jgi:hypothetical protein
MSMTGDGVDAPASEIYGDGIGAATTVSIR